MTLTAHIRVGEDVRFDYPGPGVVIEPASLSRAATYLLDEDLRANEKVAYPLIGYDARAARAHMAAEAEKDGKSEDEELKADFRIAVRAISLELIAALLLSCLDTPAVARCPCRVLMDGEKPIPYGNAPAGNPDARANYGEFAILAEVTTNLGLPQTEVDRQWDSAANHVKAVFGFPRIYCLMVSHYGLDKRAKGMAAKLAEAQERREELKREAQGNGDPEPPDAKFLVFDIEDMAEIADMLDDLYCLDDREGVQPLTEDILGRLLDKLHAQTMDWIDGEEAFPRGWAGETFTEMLYEWAVEKTPIEQVGT